MIHISVRRRTPAMSLTRMITALVVCIAFTVLVQAADTAWDDCVSDDTDRSVDGCTAGLARDGEAALSRATAFFNRGTAHYEKGNDGLAIQDLNEAVRLRPDYTIAFYNRGNLYYNMGDHNRAIQDFSEAIRLRPDFAGAFVGRGVVYGDEGEYDLAILDFNEAIRLNPDLAVAFYNRGVAYDKKGDRERAEADFAVARQFGHGLKS